MTTHVHVHDDEDDVGKKGGKRSQAAADKTKRALSLTLEGAMMESVCGGWGVVRCGVA